MSQWTYIRAVIDVSGFEIEFGNEQEKKEIEKTFDKLFKEKITGSESDCFIYYNFEENPSISSWQNGINTQYLNHCSITFIGSLRDRTIKETVQEFTDMVKNVCDFNKNGGNVYIEDHNSAGAIWSYDERVDIYPILEKLCDY